MITTTDSNIPVIAVIQNRDGTSTAIKYGPADQYGYRPKHGVSLSYNRVSRGKALLHAQEAEEKYREERLKKGK